MFSRNRMKEFTASCSGQIEQLKQALETADAVLILPPQALLIAESVLSGTFQTSIRNMGSQISTPADFIRLTHWRNTGPGGAVIFSITAM